MQKAGLQYIFVKSTVHLAQVSSLHPQNIVLSDVNELPFETGKGKLSFVSKFFSYSNEKGKGCTKITLFNSFSRHDTRIILEKEQKIGRNKVRMVKS